MMNIARALGWLLIGIILVLSLVPPTARPVTTVPHGFEHFAIFALCGVCFGLGYQTNHRLQVIFLTVFSGAIEILQLLAPGRHARIADFIVDAVASCSGVLVARLLLRISATLKFPREDGSA